MEKDLALPSGPLHVEITGEGHPLILMHGWGCSHATVRSIAATAARHCKVYNVDFPGFGDSPEPPDVWGVEEYTRIIEEMARAEGLEDPWLIGHSFGGRVAILYASRNRVGRMALVDAAGLKPRRSLKYYYKVYTYKGAKKLLRLLLGEQRAQRRIDALAARRGSSDYAGASPRMRAILSKVVNEDLRTRLPMVKASTLLIWGDGDNATPLRDGQVMERLIPDAALVIFRGCGHYSFLDNPGYFATVLSSFLSSKD